MDTQTQTPATERAAQIRTQLGTLQVEKQKMEEKLAQEHAGIRRLALKRGGLVESLNQASESDARRAHREIDECDSAIRIAERMTESLQKSLAKIVHEESTLHTELLEAEQVVKAQERQKGLEAFRIQLQQAARRAGESLDSARRDLAALGVLASRGIEAYEVNAQHICEPIFTEFYDGQANLDRRGWRFVHQSYGNSQFLIRPMTDSPLTMTRGEAAR
jgi:hypothetical protein